MDNLKICKLQLTNFRNLSTDVIEFGPSINCIYGENGNGKTNILEAVFMLATRKSFRKNTSFPQILSIDCEKTEILFSSVFEDTDKKLISYSGKLDHENSFWFLNNVPTKRKLAASSVFINPFDSYNFHNTPAFRRDWFDFHFSELDPEYKALHKQYVGILRFRNALLSKKPPQFREQMHAALPDLVRVSKRLTELRIGLLNELGVGFSAAFKRLFSEEHELKFSLQSRISNASEQQVFDLFEQNLARDEIVGHTIYGIHKDDIAIFFDGFNSLDYCSLGQQKSSYLALLFAYIDLFRYKFMSYPIVLIDDVSGELDKHRWGRLIDYLDAMSFQVLITTANEKFRDEIEKKSGVKKIKVTAGRTTNE